MSKNPTKLCLNCNAEMIERNPEDYICSNCGIEMTIEDWTGLDWTGLDKTRTLREVSLPPYVLSLLIKDEINKETINSLY
jgi:threonine synthase